MAIASLYAVRVTESSRPSDLRVGSGFASFSSDQHRLPGLAVDPRLLPAMKSLDIPQQMWLQSLIASRVMSEAHAKALHKAALTSCAVNYRSSEYDEFFSKIAKAVQIVGLEIRRTVDETKGTHVVGLVNTKGDEIAQLATSLSSHEMTFVKALIKGIVRAPFESFCLGSKDALKIADDLSPPIQAGKAELILDKLVRYGWLRLSRAGRYSLTPRTLMELQNYLQNTYEDDILFCTACEEILTSGSACSNVECDVRVHRHCMLKWERSLKNNEGAQKICSHCGKAWETAPVGEVTMSSHHGSLRQARAKRAKARARAEREAEGEDEEEEEEAEDEDNDDDEGGGGEEEEEGQEEQEEPSRRGKRRSNGDGESSRRQTRAKIEDEAEEEENELSEEEVVRPQRRRQGRR